MAATALVLLAVLLGGVVLIGGVEEPGSRLGDLVGLVVLVGLPPAVALGLLVGRVVAAARGRDLPERLLAVATAGLPGSRRAWGTAMRAELAAVEDPSERLRFARGCTTAALRTGWTRSALLVATVVGAVLAGATVATSRVSLAGDRSGSLLVVLTMVAPAVLVVASAGAAVVGGSFRAGLETGALALVLAVAGVVAAAVPEGALWARTAGTFMLDGDAPAGAITVREGALDAVTSILVLGVPLWLSFPVLGAALGAWLRGWRRVGGAGPGRPAAASASGRRLGQARPGR
ncbi:MAG TPA: hypothetical protein VH915_08630 [Pedococcus sp.]